MKTPITIHNLPDLATITKSFVDLPKNNNRHHQFLINLSATKQKDLWPNKNYIPKTKEGILFNAAKNMTNSINKRPATPSPTQDSTNLNEKAAKRNKKDSETNNSVRKKSKWWRSEEIISLLNAVEEVKPCGKNQWDIVSGLHYDSTKNVRDGDSCKLKFDRLWQTKKPTGTAEIPVHIVRALDIKELISREECIGNAGLNDVVDEDGIEELLANGGSPSNVISSTHLFDKIGNS